MVNIKYANAYSEVLEILKYIPIEDYNKIPTNRIELFKTNANNDYNFNYDPVKTLDEQKVSKIAKGIIAILFRDYWANEIQRNKIISNQNYDRLKIEEDKKEKYNADKIFYNHNKSTFESIEEKQQELALTQISNLKWYKKIWRRIKNLTHISFC